MKRVVYILLAIGLFLLAGCGARGPKLASSAEDIVGTWYSSFGQPTYMQLFEDGTKHGSSNRELVEDHPADIEKFRFEGTQLFLESTGRGFCGDVNHDGIHEKEVGSYEVHLLENGNLRFVAIEDECAFRASELQGLVDGEITAEWEPVP